MYDAGMKAPPGTVIAFTTGQRLPIGAEHRRIVVEWDRLPTRRQWRRFSGELLRLIREAEAMRSLSS